MESCFPPLASLSLRSSNNISNNNNSNSNNNNNNNNSNNKLNKHKHGTNVPTISLHNNDKHKGNSQTEFIPKLEILQDLDLYYIRQIASSLKELDLEQKIDLEIKMREGSAKLLAACNNNLKNVTKTIGFSGNMNYNSSSIHNTQMLEAAKNLLKSNERMTAYMAELQKRKKDRDDYASKKTVTTSSSTSSSTVASSTTTKSKPTGKISLSEIRIPLMWRDSDHFKNKGDHRRFAVFCLAKIGTEIYDTSLLCPIDRNLTDISFNDTILFTNVTPDFLLTLEVYSVMMESDLTIASTHKKIKNTIHSSISRTVGKRLAANLKDELNNNPIGPKFELIATANLTLSEASHLSHTYDLCLLTLPSNNSNHSNSNSSGSGGGSVGGVGSGGGGGGGGGVLTISTLNQNTTKLPLYDHFCCRLAVQPDSIETSTFDGDLQVTGKMPQRSIDGYAKLQAFKLEIWDDQNCLKNNVEPRRTIRITRETKLKHKNEFEIMVSNMEEGNLEEYILRSKSLGDTTNLYTCLKQTIKEHNIWRHVTLQPPMQLAIQDTTKNYLLRSTRQASLYDQVPILEPINKHQSTLRPTVHDIFTIPNSTEDTSSSSPTLEFRSRTNSSGRSSSHSSSTLSASSSSSINSKKNNHWSYSGK